MNRLRLSLLFVASLFLAIGLASTEVPARSGEEKVARPTDSLEYKLPAAKLTGNLSCASASCHAASGTNGPGNEYTTWVNSDPHFRAFSVLYDKQSRQMAEILHLEKPAHETELCLKCHADQSADHTMQATRTPALQGVGCEACHGPAEKYLTTHYQDDFKSMSTREKAERYGLFPTKDLAFRVSLCASCHVGDSTRQVNHDLIAAGHPRLAFEYTGYHHSRKYTRHWKETAYGPDFDSRAWEIGQVASARAAVDLLRVRAGEAKAKKASWPEFAEHSCFACHRDLNPTLSWKPLVKSTRQPGAMPWGTWYFATVDLADSDPTSVRQQLVELGRLAEDPLPNFDQIEKKAKEIHGRLGSRLLELQRSADQNSKTNPFGAMQISESFTLIARHALTEDGNQFRNLEWDGATMHYLGLAAQYYSWANVERESRDPQLRKPLVELGGLLSFPKTYNSPKGRDPAAILSEFQQLRIKTLDPHGTR